MNHDSTLTWPLPSDPEHAIGRAKQGKASGRCVTEGHLRVRRAPGPQEQARTGIREPEAGRSPASYSSSAEKSASRGT